MRTSLFQFLIVTIVFTLIAMLMSMPAFAQVANVGANCGIRWTANAEIDLLSYRVYGTLTAAAVGSVPVSKTIDVPKPTVVAPTVATTCAALGLTTGGTLSVQVDAVDTLGNRSPRSVAVSAIQDIVGPLQPTGLIITPNP